MTTEEEQPAMPADGGLKEPPKNEAVSPKEDKNPRRGAAFEKAMKMGEPDKAPENAPEDVDRKDAENTLDGKKTADPQTHQKESKAENRVQKAVNERNHYKAKLEEMQKQLEELQEMKEDEKSAKDHAMEAQLEIKMQEEMVKSKDELHSYASLLEDRDAFILDYDYYTPLLAEHDPWTISELNSYPERWQMMRKLYSAMTEGIFTLQEWAAAPPPLKLQKLNALRNSIASERSPKKEMPDSVVPNTESRAVKAVGPPRRGKAFEKAWEMGNKRI